MIIKTYVKPPIDNNNYLIIDEQTKEAALVDCSSVLLENEDILRDIKENGISLKYILLTHGHFDHVAGLRPYNSAKVVMHKDDLSQLKGVNRYLPMFGMPEINIPKVDVFVSDGDIVKLGSLNIKVIHTPGHTQGGVCYYVENSLFSGDTLFRECVGRCDLEGGNFEQIVESIKEKLFVLPEETKVYPGHGRETTIAWEKNHNNFI